jgi:hypothetical protein
MVMITYLGRRGRDKSADLPPRKLVGDSSRRLSPARAPARSPMLAVWNLGDLFDIQKSELRLPISQVDPG